VKKGDHDTLPDGPQPQGIFEKGTHFHPIEFLKTLQEVYEKVVVDRASGVDVPIEYEAFTKTVQWASGQPSIKMVPAFCSGFSISPSHPPHPINSLYFVTAANTCILMAFQDDSLALTRLGWLSCLSNLIPLELISFLCLTLSSL